MKGKSRAQGSAAVGNLAVEPAGGELSVRPSLLPQGPAQHVWDGRLLEKEQAESHAPGARTKTQTSKDTEHHQNAPFKGGTKLSALSHANKGHEQHPMTPPRVSGISLAPLPGSDCLAGPPEQPELSSHAILLAQQRRGSQTRFADMPQESAAAAAAAAAAAGAKPGRRPPAIRVAALNGASVPQPALSFGTHASTRPAADAGGGGGGPAGAAAARGDAGGAQPKAAGEVPQLMAEGRAVSLLRQHADCPDSPDSPDINLAHYREINDADSLCGTPAISLHTLRREFDHSLPLGPLSPSPLSPSILTLCGDLDTMSMRPDSSSSFSPGTSRQHTGGGGGGQMWDATLSLPDMRRCHSPDVGECKSPTLCETPQGLPQ